jgi:hypothetical protein
MDDDVQIGTRKVLAFSDQIIQVPIYNKNFDMHERMKVPKLSSLWLVLHQNKP